MQRTTKFDERFKMGQADGENIYLSAPSWDCDWYWGFGYLGNKDCHYHVDGLDTSKNLFDAIKDHFGETLAIKEDDDLWSFCELMASFYALKKTAEVLGRGGSNYGENPVREIIKNEAEAKRINNEVMPAIFDAIENIIKKYR